MSLPIALGGKSTSSRPLLIHLDDADSRVNNNAGLGTSIHCDGHKYLAEDGITPLDPIRLSNAPLTAIAVCSRQEWLAIVTVEYFDMIMHVDDGEDDDAEDDDDDGTPTKSTARRPKLTRHSTVAHVRIQISLLAAPFSSANREICHRLKLPAQNNSHRPSSPGLPSLDDIHMDPLKSSDQTPIEPCIVFSSDRQQLACLMPYPRGGQSALVAFPLVYASVEHHGKPPLLRPKVPSYIAAPSSRYSPPRPLPEARGNPQWLSLPSTAGKAPHDHDYWWLHNITAICIASTAEPVATDQRRQRKRASVLLAGCRDGSILGISFQPLLLAGLLFRPANVSRSPTSKATDREKVGSPAITFLSHVTTNAESTLTEGEDQVTGNLIALQADQAVLFKTRMVLSLLVNQEDPIKQHNHDDSTSTILHPYLHMDATDRSGTDTDADGGFATATRRIHGESFQVVRQSGRRHIVPANARLIEEEVPLFDHAQTLSSPLLDTHATMANSGLLLMFLDHCAHYPGKFCRAHWIVGSLLALLETPTVTRKSNQKEHRSKAGNSRDRVAQVIGILTDRPPEVLTELTVTLDDIRENSHTKFSLDEEEQWLDDDTKYDLDGPENTGLALIPSSVTLAGSLGIHYDSDTGCLAISSVKQATAATPQANGNGGGVADSLVHPFVCLWHWKSNVSGFTAFAASLGSSGLSCPTVKLLFSKERRTNRRRLVHLHSSANHRECSRIRKDIYELGVLSPMNGIRSGSGIGIKEASPMLLSSNSVAFAAVIQVRRL
jgi:hypothetical protein